MQEEFYENIAGRIDEIKETNVRGGFCGEISTEFLCFLW